MDITARNAFVYDMFGRFVSMLAMLAIAVVTTMTPAHAARMSAGLDQAVHVSEMMHVIDDGERSCADELHCGAADTDMCKFVCAGFTAFLPFPSAETGQENLPFRHKGFDNLLESRCPRATQPLFETTSKAPWGNDGDFGLDPTQGAVLCNRPIEAAFCAAA